jgi:hypothetical protein
MSGAGSISSPIGRKPETTAGAPTPAKESPQAAIAEDARPASLLNASARVRRAAARSAFLASDIGSVIGAVLDKSDPKVGSSLASHAYPLSRREGKCRGGRWNG